MIAMTDLERMKVQEVKLEIENVRKLAVVLPLTKLMRLLRECESKLETL
jgi:hypothetical protein